MAHQPKPFFRTGRGWYVQLGTEQIKLWPGPKNSQTEKSAWTAFHELMTIRSRPLASASPISAKSAALAVGEVFEKYLDWCQLHRSPRTYDWTRKHIQCFCDHLKVARTMAARDLKPFHIVEWVDAKPNWGANQKRGAIVAVSRPFNWAAKLGYLDVSPVRGVEKPAAQKRDSQMTSADLEALLSHVKDRPFRELLLFAYEAGCRPQEVRHIEARHVKLALRRIEIPPTEAKGKRRWRVVYLSDKAAEIITRLANERPEGKLFLNTDGKPWHAQAIVCRFQRLLVKLAPPESLLPPLPRFDRRKYADPISLENARTEHRQARGARRKQQSRLARQSDKRFAMYDLRHLFATRKLKEGHDPITVAALLGHKDASMLCKHYEEISRDGEHLRRAVN